MLSPVPGARIPTRGILSYLYQRSPTHKHRGIDLVARRGTPVQAVASGTVTHAFNDGSGVHRGFSGYGKVVVVREGSSGPYQLYSHLDNVWVSRGQRVRKGEEIGTVGNTCYRRSDPTAQCQGPHLHFEVSRNPYPQPAEAERIDPVAWLKQQGGWGLGALVALGAGIWGWRRWVSPRLR